MPGSDLHGSAAAGGTFVLRPVRGGLLLLGVVLTALLAACGTESGAPGDTPTAGAPASTPTPTATPTLTATPTPRPAASPAPTPAPARDGDLEVHFIDVGQGDATLLHAPDATMLVDAGRHDRSDVVPYLEAVGVEALDVVAISHPHADHIGQLDAVLERFDVAEVWWSGATHTTQTFERALAALEASDAAYEEPRAGDTTSVGSLDVAVVNPPEAADFDDLHDSGLAVRVSYGEVAFLFTGDAEAPTEQRMTRGEADLLAADVYQVGHHGSRTSTSSGFLDAVAPAVAVYSAGAGNSYGHPHVEVVARLVDTGVELYGTDVHGTVVVTTDGRDWTVATEGDNPPITEPHAHPELDDGPATADDNGCAPGQVDLNTASLEQLEAITQIGPERARQIIDLRPFASLDDLTRVAGIAEGRLAEIKEQGVACV